MYRSSNASSEIKAFLDGRQLTFDIPPQIMNGRTTVPLRAIFEAMGATETWDRQTQTVYASKGEFGNETWVSLTIGDTQPMVNQKPVTIDQPGVIVEGRTLVPLALRRRSLRWQGRLGWRNHHCAYHQRRQQHSNTSAAGAAYDASNDCSITATYTE